MSEVDKVVPGHKWEFDAEVAQAFDNMLERSIPGYKVMRALTDEFGFLALEKFPTASLVDLGASRGEASARFIEAGHEVYLNEISPPMLDVLQQRFKSNSKVHIDNADLTDVSPSFLTPTYYHGVILAVLTLQFLPPESRIRVLNDVYAALRPGGVFMLVEKVIGNSSPTNKMFVDLYYRMKERNGYSKTDIELKRQSLKTAMWPVTADMNESMLKNAGFKQVDVYFRHYNFCGWIAVK